ncbi:MAG: 3-deoxy-7-phosphoheptulonate synthase [Candidatus Caenarcaniphilales bacterium]|nr:3-deoxy-7-phosphoheptulonate synthase [Candidatus Caenarcaniphilales bacterium]
MIIIMEPGCKPEYIDQVVARVHELGLKEIINRGEVQTVVAVIGDETTKIPSTDIFEELPGVNRVERIQVPFRLASRTIRPEDSIIEIAPGVKIGGDSDLLVMAGPCSVETEEGIIQTALAAKSAGAQVLRGGAYKPRTAPRNFEGLGELGLRLLKQAKDETGLPIVTEIMDVRDMDHFHEVVDIFQVGARNMQNFSMLNELGKVGKPVLLKRGMAATIDEWILAAERIMHHGNSRVILCERGIRSFDAKYTRNVLDISAIPVCKNLTHLPIISDPSHGTGKSALVRSMTLASVAAGAHGLMIEIHPDPANALSDGPQSLKFDQFESLMKEVRTLHSMIKPLYPAKVGSVAR